MNQRPVNELAVFGFGFLAFATYFACAASYMVLIYDYYMVGGEVRETSTSFDVIAVGISWVFVWGGPFWAWMLAKRAANYARQNMSSTSEAAGSVLGVVGAVAAIGAIGVVVAVAILAIVMFWVMMAFAVASMLFIAFSD